MIGSCLILTGCSPEKQLQYDLIRIEGVAWASVIPTNYGTFGSTSEHEEQLEVYVAAEAGDLLYLMTDDWESYYRYQPEDGQELVVTADSTLKGSVFINGILKFLELSTDPSAWKMLEGLTRAEYDQLSVLSVTDDLTQDHLHILSAHETALHGVGLVLEAEVEEKKLVELLSICRPRWLMMENPCKSKDTDLGQVLSDLELLWISGDINVVSHLARCCPSLKTLIITDWDPMPGELFSLTKVKNLNTLTLAECGLTDLTQIEFPASLRQLHLIECDTLSDINVLSESLDLISLSLTGCDHLEHVEVIGSMQSLQRISLPPGITQSGFEEMMAALPSLQVLEMIGCTEVEDLLPLQHMPELKILASDHLQVHLSALGTLSQLDLIILNSLIFEDDPEWVSDLRSSLPGTTIVPGSGICLGSGWLLLLIPMIMVVRWTIRKRA
jgi:hypothetical protein